MGSQRVGHDWATFNSLRFTFNFMWPTDKGKQFLRSGCAGLPPAVRDRSDQWPALFTPSYSLVVKPRSPFLQAAASRWVGMVGHQRAGQTLAPMGDSGSGLPVDLTKQFFLQLRFVLPNHFPFPLPFQSVRPALWSQSLAAFSCSLSQ